MRYELTQHKKIKLNSGSSVVKVPWHSTQSLLTTENSNIPRIVLEQTGKMTLSSSSLNMSLVDGQKYLVTMRPYWTSSDEEAEPIEQAIVTCKSQSLYVSTTNSKVLLILKSSTQLEIHPIEFPTGVVIESVVLY